MEEKAFMKIEFDGDNIDFTTNVTDEWAARWMLLMYESIARKLPPKKLDEVRASVYNRLMHTPETFFTAEEKV